jgi:hypothetical protein
VLVFFLTAVILNAPVFLWVTHKQGGLALGTLPRPGKYYVVPQRMIRIEPLRRPTDPRAGTPVDRQTWRFNLYYSLASRLSFVLGLGCFLLLMGSTLYRQYFQRGPEGPTGRPGDAAKWFAIATLGAFFALVAWQIGGRTLREFQTSYRQYQTIRQGVD